MKWTNRNKIGVVVLAVAAAAFGVDHFFLHPSDSPESDQEGAANAVITRPPGARKDAAVPSSSEATSLLARRLEQTAAINNITPGVTKDAFRPPPAWFDVKAVHGVAREVAGAPPSSFQAKHKLTAVMRMGTGNGVAVFSGKDGGYTIRVGQTIDGMVLKSIGENGVHLSDGHEELDLQLFKPALAALVQ